VVDEFLPGLRSVKSKSQKILDENMHGLQIKIKISTYPIFEKVYLMQRSNDDAAGYRCGQFARRRWGEIGQAAGCA